MSGTAVMGRVWGYCFGCQAASALHSSCASLCSFASVCSARPCYFVADLRTRYQVCLKGMIVGGCALWPSRPLGNDALQYRKTLLCSLCVVSCQRELVVVEPHGAPKPHAMSTAQLYPIVYRFYSHPFYVCALSLVCRLHPHPSLASAPFFYANPP